MTPFYSEAGIQIFCGDLHDVLNQVDVRPCKIIITDPPWVRFGQGQALARGFRHVATAEDADWLAGVLAWYQHWVPTIWQLSEQSQSRCWFLLHPIYLPAFARVAHLLAWPLRGLWMHPMCEMSLALYGRGLPLDGSGEQVREAFERSPCDPDQPVRFIEALIRASGQGVVFDPFMGNGSTLVAAKRLGYEAIGIDNIEARCQAAAEALQPARVIWHDVSH